MNRFFLRIIVCLVPTLLSVGVVAWAYTRYDNGQGGFRFGVDLAGGTVLVYEVDESKMPENFKAEELAAALKKRIDPADLYNITIRPVAGTPPRVEIVLPTGGKHQAEAEKKNWNQLLDKAFAEFPGDAKGKDNPYADVKMRGENGGLPALSDAIAKNNPDLKRETISKWVEDNGGAYSSDKRLLTSEEVDKIKALIEKQGRLEFKILANNSDDKDAIAAAIAYFKDHRAEVERAANRDEPPPAPRTPGGSYTFPVANLPDEPEHTYSWVELGKGQLYTLGLNSAALANNPTYKEIVAKAEQSGEPFTLPRGSDGLFYVRKIVDYTRLLPIDRKQGKTREFFELVRDPLKGEEITGDNLVGAAPTSSQRGEPAISFTFNSKGGNLFYDLTSKNKPAGDFHRQLAIIFDGQIVSAPSLNEPIRTQGQITGKFTKDEIDNMVRILRAGALPATLKKEPVSQNSMGSTLGEDTIRKGTWSVGIAFLAVMAFMVFYYRFAGVVACIALLANLLMTVAFMVLVQAAFTLPGLAGLVLMLGMAVDANVLIYERLREERERGATLALAIRNGYDRAFPTIVDTHLSSIFTAIVLYVVGNDQLKGFGISLTVGLIISLFTSLYMTRTIFEICLAKGWVKSLGFFNGLVRLIHSRYWDFMSIRYYWFTATIILTIGGAALFIYRLDSNPATGKSSVLNIDFIGGTAYTAQLSHPLTLEDLRKELEGRASWKQLVNDAFAEYPGNARGKENPYRDVEEGDFQALVDAVAKNNPGVKPETIAGQLGQIRNEQPLPDLSIEQIFVSGDQTTAGNASRFFTVRTSEKDIKKVFAYVQSRLGDDLKRIKVSQIKIVKPGQEAELYFRTQDGKEPDYASPAQVQLLMSEELGKRDLARASFAVERPTTKGLEQGDEDRFSQLTVKMTEPLSADKKQAEREFASVLDAVKADFDKAPQPERLENFDRQLAANTQERALYAILASWAAILLYLWFRFGSWTFGAATVLCLIHDLFFTLGAIALCHYVHEWAPWLAPALLIQDFKIDLPSVAALLTLVGYSVNDTIVVFDRIREVRGKNPALTPQIINDSVNQTLTRTILASMTVWLVVIVLYIWGGEGVHLFAFVMVVGVIVGTYSSIYIASPLLLIFGEGAHASQGQLERAGQPTGAKG
jgi:SecD/SecF fusion protein